MGTIVLVSIIVIGLYEYHPYVSLLVQIWSPVSNLMDDGVVTVLATLDTDTRADNSTVTDQVAAIPETQW